MEETKACVDNVVVVIKPIKPLWGRKWTFLDKKIALFFLVLHLLCVLSPFYFSWPAFWLALAIYINVGLFGITLSYHRNLSHKSLKLPKWLEYLFAYFGVFAFQGDPIGWVSKHRYHHQFVDTERDPHSPIEGFWFSHILWMMDSSALNKKVYSQYAKKNQERKMDICLKHGTLCNVGDLEKQMFYRIIHKTYFLHLLTFGVALYAKGGMPFLTWGLGVPITLFYHATFMVNSVCHIWGKQPWDTNDLSKNNGWVALVTFGEGWHNNHHAFEYSARHGFEWWQLDFTWYAIKFLTTLGLATDVKLPTQKQKLARNTISKNTSK